MSPAACRPSDRPPGKIFGGSSDRPPGKPFGGSPDRPPGKILVTGAGGQLGRCLQDISRDMGWDIVFRNRDQLDITDKSALESLFNKHEDICFCVNCAAWTNVELAETETDAAMKVNGIAPGFMAELAEKFDFTLIHISTDYVFDGKRTNCSIKSDSPDIKADMQAMLYGEAEKTNPLSIYGKTKLAGEQAVLDGSSSSIVIRTSWLYSEFGMNFVKKIAALSSRQRELQVVSQEYSSPTYARDLASHIVDIARCIQSEGFPVYHKKTDRIYHYSNEGVVSRFDFACAIIRELGLNVSISPVPKGFFPMKAVRPDFSGLECERIKNHFHIRPRGWEQALADCAAKLRGL